MTNPLGVIVAGGQSRRFNESRPEEIDKFLMPFGKTTLLEYIIDRAKKQVPNLILNVNGDVDRVLPYGLDIIKDDFSDAGPLGGIYTAMKEAAAKGHSHIVTFSSDSPYFPDDYVTRLTERQDIKIAIASSGEKYHPVMGLFEVSLRDDLKAYLESGERRVMWWVRRHPYRQVVWDKKNPDPFLNINTEQDLAEAEKFL